MFSYISNLKLNNFRNYQHRNFNFSSKNIAFYGSNGVGKTNILEAISMHEAVDTAQAENIIERILPRLAHNNPAVILSAVKVVLMNLEKISNEDFIFSSLITS